MALAAGQPAGEGAVHDNERARKRLVLAQQFLTKVVNFSPQPVFVKDEKHRFVLLNDAFCDFLGKTRQELLGKSDYDFFPEEEAKVFWEKDDEVFRSEEVVENEESFTDQLGANHYIVTRKAVFSTDDGRRYLVGTILNITERRKAELALEAQRGYLDNLINGLPRPIYVKDESLRFALVNLAFCELHGLAADEIIGRSVSDLLGPDQSKKLEDIDRQVLETGEPVEMETIVKARDGTERQVLVRKSAFSGADGSRHLVGAITDVSKLKAIQEELASHRERLEELVEKRTEEVRRQAAQLEEALGKSRELNKMQGQFVSMVSHEFRTPLAIIDAAAQRVLKKLDALDPLDVDRRMGKIRGAVSRMTELVESTLSASRLEAGKIAFAPARCEVRALLQAACMRQASINPKHRIDVDVSKMPAEIVADQKLLGHVFGNLLSNAVKYSPNEEPIEVRGWQRDETLFIEVKDHGLGIPEQEMPKLFEKYFRASTSAGIKGTGIGLHMIKSFVDMHGGEISVNSVVDEGSVFRVSLPIPERLTLR